MYEFFLFFLRETHFYKSGFLFEGFSKDIIFILKVIVKLLSKKQQYTIVEYLEKRKQL